MVSAALKLPPLESNAPATRRPEIVLRDISVAYPVQGAGMRNVLAAIDLEIEAGEFVVLLGETGCGKSTLLRLIIGQELPTSGSILLDGKPVKRIDARCGYVPQKYSLFPDRTVLGNVLYGPLNASGHWFGFLQARHRRTRRVLRDEAMHTLERLGLRKQDFNKYPHQLSGGMQQRVAIAQALIMKPPVLLMDEAFSALDPHTRENLQEQLHAIWLELRPTIVFVTHNTTEALTLGTRLILLGRHQDDGDPQSNLLLDTDIPSSRLPFARRKQSAEFQELLESVKQMAFRSSSMCRDIQTVNSIATAGDL